MLLKNAILKFKNKNGSSTVELVNVLFIFLVLLIASVELFSLGYKYISLSSFANNLAQTVSIQGGIQQSSPKGYETANVSYMKTSDIFNAVDSLADIIRQDRDSITIKVRYQKTNSNGTVSYNTVTLKDNSNIKIDYGNWFEITVECKLENLLAGNLVPIDSSLVTISRTKGSVSQFEYNYDL